MSPTAAPVGRDFRPGFRGSGAVRLAAAAAPEVFAAALNRPWPDDLDGRVRCLDEGARALGLALSCAPWSPAAEDAALAAELGLGSGSAAAPGLVSADLDAGGRAGPTPAAAPALDQLDAVAAGLAGTPAALPVLGAVSGPVAWGARIGGDPEEALDAASDLAAARIRAMHACGAERVIVVEAGPFDLDPDLAAEVHRPILRAADHLRMSVSLVVASAAGGDPARLGYERWASPDGCSEGLAFLPAGVFESPAALSRGLDERRGELAGAAEAITAPLGPAADPAAVRAAAARLAELPGRGSTEPGERREGPG